MSDPILAGNKQKNYSSLSSFKERANETLTVRKIIFYPERKDKYILLKMAAVKNFSSFLPVSGCNTISPPEGGSIAS